MAVIEASCCRRACALESLLRRFPNATLPEARASRILRSEEDDMTSTSLNRHGRVQPLAVLLALRLWPAYDPDAIEHVHDALDANHPQLADAVQVDNGRRHTHAYVIDSHH